MKDIAALCRRVVIIAGGMIKYDGSLSGVIDKFSGSKVVTLQFAEGDQPNDLHRFGEVIDTNWPKVRLKITRADVPDRLAAALQQYRLEDVAVEDPPLEDVIADLFSQVDVEAA